MRHTNIVNVLASAMNRAFIDVENEPILQPVTEHQKAKIIEKNKTAILDDDARSDIRVNGFWTHNEQAFFDIRVFYPHAKSYENKNIEEVYKIHRNEKKNHTTVNAFCKLSTDPLLPLYVEALTKKQWLP